MKIELILDFISKMTTALVWPFITIGFIYFFREQIRPLLKKLRTIKLGGLEAEFHELSVTNQSLIFLDSLARKEQWTFYEEKRENERNLGPAFLGITNDLLSVEKEELFKKLREWLISENPNLIWFASEIIGCYRLKELRSDLSFLIPNNKNQDLESYQLNCIWAYSRITNIESLKEFLLKTKSKANQSWILFVYKQMPYDDDKLSKENRIKILKDFISRSDVIGKPSEEAKSLLKYFKELG